MKASYDSQKDLILIGAGGHCRVIIEMIEKYHPDIEIIGITDINPLKKEEVIDGIEVLGDDKILEELLNRGVKKAFISVGSLGEYEFRQELCDRVKSMGFELINIIHGTSYISEQAKIGLGNVVMAKAVINTGAIIGNNNIINTGSIVEHGCILGDNVHIAPGAIVCGDVSIGDNSFVGAGATIKNGIKIGSNVIIGAGSVVIEDIPSDSKAYGVPAKVV